MILDRIYDANNRLTNLSRYKGQWLFLVDCCPQCKKRVGKEAVEIVDLESPPMDKVGGAGEGEECRRKWLSRWRYLQRRRRSLQTRTGLICAGLVGTPGVSATPLARVGDDTPSHKEIIAMIQPKVFISYSHDSQEHMDEVLALTDSLRNHGVDAYLDQYIESPPEGWPRWMENQISEANFVLLICTEIYNRRFSGKEQEGQGLGATWEGAIVTQTLYESSLENTRFIPVLLKSTDRPFIPPLLRGVTYYDVTQSGAYELLYRRLTAQPLTMIPPLGNIKRMPPLDRKQIFQPVLKYPYPLVTPGASWDSEWIASHRARAMEGWKKIGKSGFNLNRPEFSRL